MNKKKMAAPIITVMMVVAIFAAMAGPASAGYVDISKETFPDPNAVYEIGDEITYELIVTNSNPICGCTVDVYDEYPNGTEVQIANNVHLGTGNGIVTYYTTYVVDENDIQPDGRVWNILRIDGVEDDPCGGAVRGSVEEGSHILTEVTFDFTFRATGCMEVEFKGSSTGPVDWHKWDFGDGHYSPEIGGAPNAGNAQTHTYTSCTDKTVRLFGESITGEYNDTEQTVHVKCGPTAKATVNPACVVEAGDMATFNASASTAGDSPIDTYQWTFSDAVSGSSDNSVTTTRAIPEAGVIATLTVTDTLDCEDTDTVQIGVCVEYVGCAIRLYGTFGEGAGNQSVIDPATGLEPENKPYSDPEGPFYPQHPESPRKDFMTFNPVIMDHNDDDFDYSGLDFDPCEPNTHIQSAKEKVFKRMWYEKDWFKDDNANGIWDLYGSSVWNNDPAKGDVYGPAIVQEFTYMFLDDLKMPAMIENGSRVLIPMAHREPSDYRGLNSFDAKEDDGISTDYVKVESEKTLGIDIDQDGTFESMDMDTTELNGNESVVLVLDKRLEIGEEIQFFDTKVELLDVYGPSNRKADFLVSDNEGGSRHTEVTINEDGYMLFYRAMPDTEGTTFYLKVTAIDWTDSPYVRAARIEVGRMFGQTYANIGANVDWNQKAFIVDNVFYNVVAIKAQDDCIKYITFRQKLPKMPIKLYGLHLEEWDLDEILPEMPPFNMNHRVLLDVLNYQFIPQDMQDKIGDPSEIKPPLKITYVEEETEERYYGSLLEIYNETRVMDLCECECICEDPEKVCKSYFGCCVCVPGDWKGDPTEDEVRGFDKCICPDPNYDCKSIDGECRCPCECEVMEDEKWVLEWFHTYPDQYTAFRLPPEERVLVTLSWIADEAETTIWNGDSSQPLEVKNGDRVKFWYDDCTGPLYIDEATDSIRVYGTFGEGAGDHDVIDPATGLKPENKPYSDPEGPFFPQHPQAPVKDFMTFNPAIMDHNQGYDELDFDLCEDSTNVQIPKEKVFKRMWYEKDWFKDQDKDGCWDVVIERKSSGTYYKTMCLEDWNALPEWSWEKINYRIREGNNDPALGDKYAPAIIQEFTYMTLDDNTMPIMVESGSRVLIPMAHNDSLPYRGLNSFDADGDGARDALRIESEFTLGIDIDQDGLPYEPMDADGIELSGDESIVLVLDKRLEIDEEIQFFDTKVKLENVYGPTPRSAEFIVSDNEGGSRSTTLEIDDDTYVLFYRAMPDDEGTTFYLKVNAIDWTNDPDTRAARIEVGRMFGQTYANIEANVDWNQKAFIVDNVFYSVVAIKAQDDCFKYITFRQKLPKMPMKLYGVHLEVWGEGQLLPEMAPFCEDHEILVDILKTHPRPYTQQDKIGMKVERPPLAITYVEEDTEERFSGSLLEIYNETRVMDLCECECICEDPEKVCKSYFGCCVCVPGDWKGDPTEDEVRGFDKCICPDPNYDCKSIDGECRCPCECEVMEDEKWVLEWFHTYPEQYTAFTLPEGELYLMTLAWFAPEAKTKIWDGDPAGAIASYTGDRAKFWYDPADQTDIYINRIPAHEPDQPDLDITEVICPDNGEISYTVENIGDADAGAFDVSITATGVSETDSITGLAAGVSVTRTVAVDCVETGYTVCADSGNDVAESDETNNCMNSGSCTCDWNTWNDDCVISDDEISNAEYYWATNTPINGHIITDPEISSLEYQWVTGDVC